MFPAELERRLGAKLGLPEARPEGKALIEGILKLLAQDKVDFTIFWRTLSRWVASNAPLDDAAALTPVRDLFIDRSCFRHLVAIIFRATHA